MRILFKIPFAQTKQRRSKELCVAADVITESRSNLATVFVKHHLGRIVIERTFVAPVLLLARQERPALQHEDALAAPREFVQQRAAACARSDDDDVVVVVHDGSWSLEAEFPYTKGTNGFHVGCR